MSVAHDASWQGQACQCRVTKLPVLKMVLLDKAAHASRRLTRTFRHATWPFPAPSADSTISILSKMRCLACAAAVSVGPGTALRTGFKPGCSWRGQQKFSTALFCACLQLAIFPGSCMSAKIFTMTDLQPSTGPKGHQAQVPFALTHRHSDCTSFYSKHLLFVSDCLTQTPLHGRLSNSSARLQHDLLGSR